MSFLAILKKVAGVVLGVEHTLAPIAEIALPGFSPIISHVDDLFTRLQTAITTAEVHPPLVTGAAKAAQVVADFEAGLDVALAAIGLTGHHISYDAAALKTAIDAQVAAYNAMSAVKASFKFV